mgnify:CR=1 FL=1
MVKVGSAATVALAMRGITGDTTFITLSDVLGGRSQDDDIQVGDYLTIGSLVNEASIHERVKVLEVDNTNSGKATDFEHSLSYGDTLRRCQRYLYVLADGSDLADQSIGNGMAWSSSQMEITISWPVVMRTTPSLIQSTGTNYYQWRNSGNEKFTNSLQLANVTPRHGILYQNNITGLNTGDAYRVQLGNSSAYLYLSAEL